MADLDYEDTFETERIIVQRDIQLLKVAYRNEFVGNAPLLLYRLLLRYWTTRKL